MAKASHPLSCQRGVWAACAPTRGVWGAAPKRLAPKHGRERSGRPLKAQGGFGGAAPISRHGIDRTSEASEGETAAANFIGRDKASPEGAQ